MIDKFNDYIDQFEPSYTGYSPVIVNDTRFHIKLRDYIIPLPESYTNEEKINIHRDTMCQCRDIPNDITNYLILKTKELLDKINGKFSYAAFVFTNNIDKQEVKHHLHIQSIFERLDAYKDIALFVSFDGVYDFKYYSQPVDKDTVLSNELYLRNNLDMVGQYIIDNSLQSGSNIITGGQAVIFDGQTMIHGGNIISGSGIWVVLSMCTTSVDIKHGGIVIV
jgi:hypothetical protein